MRINHEIGFIHVPKTGGQSIEHLVMERFLMQREEGLLVRNRKPSFGPPRLAHLTINEYKTIYQYSPDRWFALLRNPLDRFLSEMKFRGINAEQAEVFLNKVQFGLLEDEYQTGEDYRRHSMHQSDFFTSGVSVWLMQFEVFMLDPLRHLNELLSIDWGQTFPHITPKATNTRKQEIRVNRTTERKLEDFYAADFELWSRCGEDAWAQMSFPTKRRHFFR